MKLTKNQVMPVETNRSRKMIIKNTLLQFLYERKEFFWNKYPMSKIINQFSQLIKFAH